MNHIGMRVYLMAVEMFLASLFARSMTIADRSPAVFRQRT
jgi:hypothetical protein